MSYDVYIVIDTGAAEPVEVFWRNYTSNCGPMWRHAGADLQDFNGAPCTEAVGPLAEAVKRMEADPDTYRAMNPANGWGDYESCLEFMRDIATACAEHTKASMRVSW